MECGWSAACLIVVERGDVHWTELVRVCVFHGTNFVIVVGSAGENCPQEKRTDTFVKRNVVE